MTEQPFEPDLWPDDEPRIHEVHPTSPLGPIVVPKYSDIGQFRRPNEKDAHDPR